MRKFEHFLGPWVFQYRWWIIVASLLFAALAVSGGRYLTFENDSRIFFGPENPQLRAFDAMERTYTKNDNVIFVLTAADGNVFAPKVLDAVEWLTSQAWQVPYSSRVDSLSNFQFTLAEEDDLVVSDLYSNALDLTKEEVSLVRERALAEPLLVQRLVNPQGSVTSVMVTINKPEGLATAVSEITQFSRDLGKQFTQNYPDIRLHIGGGVLFNNAFMEASMNDMSTLVPLMYLILVVVMYALLRSVSGTVATFIIIGLSMATAMGISGWVGIALSPPSANSPTIILTIAIAHCIHILSSMGIQMRKGIAKREALIESMRINTQPIILTSVTTAIGFLSMNTADAPPFHALGNIVAIGSMVAMVFSLTTLPALIAVLPMPVPKQEDGKYHQFMEQFGEFVVRRTKVLTYGTMALVIILIAGMSRIELDDNFITYFDESYDIRQFANYTMENLTGLDFLEFSVDSGEPAGINDPEYLQLIENFANFMRQQQTVSHVAVLTDIVKRLNRNMNNDDEEFYRIPDNRELAAQYLLLYEMSLPFGLDLNNTINLDKSATRVIVTLNNATAAQMRELDRLGMDWLRQNGAADETFGASLSLMFSYISERNINTMLFGTVFALFLVSMVLLLALRSFKIGIISLLPNLFPAAMAFGIWGYLEGNVGMVASIVGAMSLGIIVDDTVHFLSKYLRARREHNCSAEAGVRYAFTSVGKALVTTTVILIAGFSMLAFSGFKLNEETGLLTAIAIFMAIITDFFLLPGILLMFDKKGRDEKTTA